MFRLNFNINLHTGMLSDVLFSVQRIVCELQIASAGEQIASRRVAIFSHIARLGEEVPAHHALRAHVDLSLGRLLGRDSKRRPSSTKQQMGRSDS